MGYGYGLGYSLGRARKTGKPALVASQSFGVEIVATKLEPLIAAQSFGVEIVATESTIGPLDLLSILTAEVTVRSYHIADLGVTDPGTLTWADQSGNSVDYTQGTAANKPTLVTGISAIGSRAAFDADGSNDTLVNTGFNLATGNWILAVFLQDTWTLNDALYGANGTSNRYVISQGAGVGDSPSLQLRSNTAATPNNVGAPLDTWTRAQALCVNSTSAYLKLAGTTQTGVAPGSGFGSTGRAIFSQSGTNFFDGMCALLVVCATEPSAGVKADADDWIAEYYGGGVAIA